MPKQAKDYSLCKVYRVVSEAGGCQYIGSTCEKYLCQRMGHHRTDFRQWKRNEGAPYITVFEVLEHPDARIELIQAYPECKSFDEQRMYEQQHQDQNECVNKQRAYCSKEQRAKQNCASQQRQRKRHPEKFKEKERQFRETHKEQKREYDKKYREQHRDKKLAQDREYYQKRREALQQVVRCDTWLRL